MDFYSISEKRKTQIEDFLKSPLTVGEEVYVTIDGFICSDCIIDRCIFEEDFEESEE